MVLTGVYSELVAQKDLFIVSRRVTSRDHRILSIALLFLGGFSGRAIIQTAGAPTALGVAAAIRLIVTLWWLFVPEMELSLSLPQPQETLPGQGPGWAHPTADVESG